MRRKKILTKHSLMLQKKMTKKFLPSVLSQTKQMVIYLVRFLGKCLFIFAYGPRESSMNFMFTIIMFLYT